jgi:hypothetical protein
MLHLAKGDPAEVGLRLQVLGQPPTAADPRSHLVSPTLRPNNATIAALKDEVAQLRRRLGEQAPLTGRASQIADESSVPPEVPTIVPSRTSPPIPDSPVSSIPAPQPTAFGADVAPSNVFLEQPEPFHLQLPASPGRMDQEEHFSPAQSTNRIHAGGDGWVEPDATSQFRDL